MGAPARVITDLNVSATYLQRNIIRNTKRKLQWVSLDDKLFSGDIAIIAGAPSLKDKLEDIRQLKESGVMLMALNGAHDFLVDNGIIPDFFSMLDARSCNDFVNKPQDDCIYLLASQAHPKMFEKLKNSNLMLWHCEHEEFPRKEVNEIVIKQGRSLQWTTISAKKTVGLTSMLLCYTMGFSRLHLFGFDSSFSNYQHSYKQKQNEKDDRIKTIVGDKEFLTTPTLLNQAQLYCHVKGALELKGVEIVMRSEGLIKAMHEAKEGMTIEQREACKYLDIWDINEYRHNAPGLRVAPMALGLMEMKKGSSLVDFGIGSGKAASAFIDAGFKVLGVDIAANCLDAGRFIPLCIAPLWDIPENVTGDYGYCTDVMEHIPTEKVDDVLKNIARCVKNKVFFQIDLHDDKFGIVIGDVLHLTVKPSEWWREKLSQHFVISEFIPQEQTLIAVCNPKKENK